MTVSKAAVEAYNQRVIEETRALDADIVYLESLLASDYIKEITPLQHSLLSEQLTIMLHYSAILHKRIVHF